MRETRACVLVRNSGSHNQNVECIAADGTGVPRFGIWMNLDRVTIDQTVSPAADKPTICVNAAALTLSITGGNILKTNYIAQRFQTIATRSSAFRPGPR